MFSRSGVAGLHVFTHAELESRWRWTNDPATLSEHIVLPSLTFAWNNQSCSGRIGVSLHSFIPDYNIASLKEIIDTLITVFVGFKSE